jgi:hypothetical protein
VLEVTVIEPSGNEVPDEPLPTPVMFSTVVLEVYVESGWLIGVKSAEATDAKNINATKPTDFFSNPERNMGRNPSAQVAGHTKNDRM